MTGFVSPVITSLSLPHHRQMQKKVPRFLGMTDRYQQTKQGIYHTSVPQQATGAVDKLRFLTLNVQRVSGRVQFDALNKGRHERMANAIAVLQPDVVLLQEVKDLEGTESLLSYFGLRDRYPNVVFCHPQDVFKEQSLVHEKCGFVVLSNRKMSLKPGKLSAISTRRSSRPVLKTTFETGDGQNLHVFNVHLQSALSGEIRPEPNGKRLMGFLSVDKVRLQMIEEVAQRIRQIRQHNPDARIVVGGDFNVAAPEELERFSEVMGLNLIDNENATCTAGATLDTFFVSDSLLAEPAQVFQFNTKTYSDPPTDHFVVVTDTSFTR